jgi:hypothetical protein
LTALSLIAGIGWLIYVLSAPVRQEQPA